MTPDEDLRQTLLFGQEVKSGNRSLNPNRIASSDYVGKGFLLLRIAKSWFHGLGIAPSETSEKVRYVAISCVENVSCLYFSSRSVHNIG